ncbi:hypothetical protein [Butyrivibrio sp. VCB2006]|uniref:hypothetical protein n=1 Tax=Butyrivibrio sp. VCB2006 TaxID=1280679 RepID=UPI0004090AE7|nr:hypothetical protein [Butyrivibrio sp. VCB2006]
MNFIPLNVSLDEKCLPDFIRRYHFEEKDIAEISRLYKCVSPRVHAEFHYVVDANTDSNCNDGKQERAIVLVTLGQAFDEYQESFLNKGDIHKGYILDCIGLELLWAAYEDIDKKIHELTGKFLGNYTFAGDKELPITDLPRLMNRLGQKMVTYNEAYVLIPKKSVVFITPLLEEEIRKYARCAACSNTKCSMRETA